MYEKDEVLMGKETTRDERLFCDMVRQCCTGGIISGKEERLLKRLQLKLRLQDERANQLRKIVESDLLISKEELEYLDEIKFALKEGSIPDGKRRLLNGLRQDLNISEERGAFLEDTIKNPNSYIARIGSHL